MLQTGLKKHTCNGAFRQGIYEQDVTVLFFIADPPLTRFQDINTC